MGKNPERITDDPIYEPTDYNSFEVVGIDLDEWKDFDPDAQEMMSCHMPEEFVKYVVIKYYMGANQEGNMADRRSHSSIAIYVNNAPII